MNPRVQADEAEVGRWLRNFATSHAKREDSRIEAEVRAVQGPESRTYELSLVLGAQGGAPVSVRLGAVSYVEVAEGRTRLDWCATQARRIRQAARDLSGLTRADESRPA